MAQDQAGGAERQFDEFIFQRELNEVYLLLDFLSGRTDATLGALHEEASEPAEPASDVPDPAPAAASVQVSVSDGTAVSAAAHLPARILPASRIPQDDIITRICRLRYPPEGQREVKASDAAFLLRARDRLNLLASPASGLTIAFTAMVAGSATEFAGDTTAGNSKTRRRTSRVTLAYQAYPGLRRRAERVKLAFNLLIGTGLIVALSTVFLSGEAAFAKSLLDRYLKLEADRAQLNETIGEVEATESASAATSSASPADAEFKQTGMPPYCERPKILFKNEDRYETATQQHLCSRKTHLQANIVNARRDLSHWLAGVGHFVPSFLHLDWAFPADPDSEAIASSFSSSREDSDLTARQRSYELPILISSLLTILGTYVLPMLYGFLGSTASAVRDFSRKMRDSTFAPRDFTLASIRLALGVLAGASVGLFFSSAPSIQNGTDSGGLVVSASALAFLAGYGVEVFFVMLDSLIARIFARTRTQPHTASQAK